MGVLGPQIFDRNSSRFPGRVVTRKIRGGFRIMFGASMLHDGLILVLQIVEAILKIKKILGAPRNHFIHKE